MLDIAGVVGAATALAALYGLYTQRMPDRIESALTEKGLRNPDELDDQLSDLRSCRQSLRWFMVGHTFFSIPLLIVAVLAILSINPSSPFNVTLFAGLALALVALVRLRYLLAEHLSLSEMADNVEDVLEKVRSRQVAAEHSRVTASQDDPSS